MKHTFNKYEYAISGIQIGNSSKTFEDSVFLDKELLTEKEILIEVSNTYLEKGYIVTKAELYTVTKVTIDLVTNEITEEKSL